MEYHRHEGKTIIGSISEAQAAPMLECFTGKIRKHELSTVHVSRWDLLLQWLRWKHKGVRAEHNGCEGSVVSSIGPGGSSGSPCEKQRFCSKGRRSNAAILRKTRNSEATAIYVENRVLIVWKWKHELPVRTSTPGKTRCQQSVHKNRGITSAGSQIHAEHLFRLNTSLLSARPNLPHTMFTIQIMPYIKCACGF